MGFFSFGAKKHPPPTEAILSENPTFQDVCRAKQRSGAANKKITALSFYKNENPPHSLKEDDKPNAFRYPTCTYI